MRDLTNLATALGLTIIEEYGRHAAGYRPDENVIRLWPGLSAVDRRSLLAHELGHHVLGHVPTPPGVTHDKNERAASEWAADRLISLAAYREVEAIRGGHIESMAHDLEVHPKLVVIYRDRLARIGDAVYRKPRIGAGQFSARVAA